MPTMRLELLLTWNRLHVHVAAIESLLASLQDHIPFKQQWMHAIQTLLVQMRRARSHPGNDHCKTISYMYIYI